MIRYVGATAVDITTEIENLSLSCQPVISKPTACRIFTLKYNVDKYLHIFRYLLEYLNLNIMKIRFKGRIFNILCSDICDEPVSKRYISINIFLRLHYIHFKILQN